MEKVFEISASVALVVVCAAFHVGLLLGQFLSSPKGKKEK